MAEAKERLLEIGRRQPAGYRRLTRALIRAGAGFLVGAFLRRKSAGGEPAGSRASVLTALRDGGFAAAVAIVDEILKGIARHSQSSKPESTPPESPGTAEHS